ncbi:hypothetical protein FOMPIDRAFT_81981 [Fomitopsis schrenkii]|uniref:Uncharacterized protein n=1 Tax=Fomitopsis schrenkii TaxID=2126942 RepID=S8EP09_FOMSC|nr:hypothetical protein FOMPIDRAFT_81981 [Fomitopsis schrenkii]
MPWLAIELPKQDLDSKGSREPVAPTSTEDNDERSSKVAATPDKGHAAGGQGARMISVSKVLCEHGRLNSSNAGNMKLITGAAQ